jgi:hypothetical protein
MKNWISKGGRVAVFTRDMTWANDNDMKKLLTKKAKDHELLLIMPEKIELSNQLETDGAEIFTYQELNHDPESRFTIIHKGRMDSEVAVGRKVNGKHKIEEFQKGQHPIFSIADDLIDILIKYNKINNERGNRNV